jgi:hypothetical protein
MNEQQNTPEKKSEETPETILPAAGGGHTPAQATQSSSEPQRQTNQQSDGQPRKRWQKYFFEFLLVFSAVFLGFWADSFREYLEEKSKEREYMKSMVNDLKNDSLVIIQTNDSILVQIRKIDTIQGLLSSRLEDGSYEVKRCYSLSDYIQKYYPVLFNEGTISQLTSSGNMRLVKKEGVTDNILAYYSSLKHVEKQGEFYSDGIKQCMNNMFNVYDIEYMRTAITEDSIKRVNPNGDKLLTTDPFQVKKLIAVMESTKVSANLYLLQLQELYQQASNLLGYLRKKYKIKDEEIKEPESTTGPQPQ